MGEDKQLLRGITPHFLLTVNYLVRERINSGPPCERRSINELKNISYSACGLINASLVVSLFSIFAWRARGKLYFVCAVMAAAAAARNPEHHPFVRLFNEIRMGMEERLFHSNLYPAKYNDNKRVVRNPFLPSSSRDAATIG